MVQQEIKAPSKFLLLGESRSIFELGAGVAMFPLLNKLAPRGDGSPVLVLPGLGASDLSTKILRAFLNDLDYKAYGWKLGTNRGLINNVLETITAQVEEIYSLEGKKVSIVGQSLGGVFAREVAKKVPHLVKQVLTLGSPFTGDLNATNGQLAYKILSGQPIDENTHALFASISEKPPVPTTSIFSKFDGIVAWQCSIEANRKQSENIELIGGSHIGMASSPPALYLIAERLSQKNYMWHPFQSVGILKAFYKVHY